jgi:hypothetical protein
LRDYITIAAAIGQLLLATRERYVSASRQTPSHVLAVDKTSGFDDNSGWSDRYFDISILQKVAAFMAFFRQFAAQLLLTVVSAMSLLGTGLHLLPGCDHFHDSCDSGCEQAGCCHHDAGHHDGDNCPADSNCAICRFLAIPWALTSPPAIVDGGRPFEFLVATAAPAPATEALRLYSARAPPRLSSAS